MPRKVGSSTFGTRLCELREAKGLTQKALGEMTGIHANTIAKLERGEQEPAWPMVLLFADALGTTCTAFGGLAEESTVPAAEQKRGRGRPKKGDDAPEGKGKAK